MVTLPFCDKKNKKNTSTERAESRTVSGLKTDIFVLWRNNIYNHMDAVNI